ncbi:ATP-binding protein [Adlercreutzia sp. ZJ242]|uniref:ATP-binding protein n=1 Tax=Adlercreutzia sp. ZJ242 TaxID=2709409 RepID=UPI0013EB2FC5|nr:AAA family ATPase [Adlercreutzia sp. ZJ242]
MLKRKAADRLEAWLANDEKKALLVSGARQVGKTYLIDAFVAEHFENVAKFDLVEDASVQASFSQATSADDLFLRISLAARVPLVPGKTVVFIDEVQKAPEIMTFVKYLVKNTGLRYVLSGSLLGIALENIRSQPVGYVREVEMFPLDFEEFCWANGVNRQAFEMLSESISKQEEVPGFLHDQLLSLYHRYLIVGGMPAAVSAFVGGRGIDAVRSEQADIHAFYKRDITQYAPKEQRLVIQDIYDLIPSEISARSRRFKLGKRKNNRVTRKLQEAT